MAISNQKTSLFFRLSLSVTVLGALFKFISLPLILLGVAGMVIFHTLQFFQKPKRLLLDYARQLLIMAFSANYAFSIFNLSNGNLLSLFTKISLIIFLLLYIKKILSSTQESSQNGLLQNINTENLAYILADLATVYIVIASLFKILHWEFGIINANVLLVIGLFTALISMLASSKYVGN